jgi:lysophospholipase L1-like esterase
LAGGVLLAGSVVVTAACASDGGSDSVSASTSGSSSVSSSTAEASGQGTYLALGDSVPFGYRGGLGAEYQDPTNFVGYPELVGKDLGLRVVNATCPGETTASLVDASAQSNGCENSLQAPFGFRSTAPLHVRYASAKQSQLDYALGVLAKTRDVRLVTLQIGANDAFLCQQTTADNCTSQAELQSLTQTVQANVAGILAKLRTAGHFDGRIVVVTYYAPDYTGLTGAGTQQLDSALAAAAQQNGATVADGFAAFRAKATASGGSSTAAGLVYPNDVHPTAAGQRLLADAVEVVVPH